MSMFTKKETIVLNNEHQKDEYIEKLNKANVEYDIAEDRETLYIRKVTYIIHVKASDMKKVS